jgi:hypothetical protein
MSKFGRGRGLVLLGSSLAFALGPLAMMTALAQEEIPFCSAIGNADASSVVNLADNATFTGGEFIVGDVTGDSAVVPVGVASGQAITFVNNVLHNSCNSGITNINEITNTNTITNNNPTTNSNSTVISIETGSTHEKDAKADKKSKNKKSKKVNKKK